MKEFRELVDQLRQEGDVHGTIFKQYEALAPMTAHRHDGISLGLRRAARLIEELLEEEKT